MELTILLFLLLIIVIMRKVNLPFGHFGLNLAMTLKPILPLADSRNQSTTKTMNSSFNNEDLDFYWYYY